MKSYYFKKSILIISFTFLGLGLLFSLSETVLSQSVDVKISKEEGTMCVFNNTKMAILSIVKNITGVPDVFNFNTIPTPSTLSIKPVEKNGQDKYTGQDRMILDPGLYKVLEAVPSFNWIMKNVSCSILPVCGDEICDTSTEVGENCNNCPSDCKISSTTLTCPSLPPNVTLLPPPSFPLPIEPSTPTGKRIINKNGMEDVELIVGRTTECVFDNELMTLKIVSNVIGGDGTEDFDYNIKLYNSQSPAVISTGLNVLTNNKIREDKVRGDEWVGSDGIYLNSALTSYVITEEISDGWTLNSVQCEMQNGQRTGVPTIYKHGVINVTVETDKVTTCTFTKTKKGEIKIVKNAKGAKEGEKFEYEFNFVSTEYLEPASLAISSPLPKPIIKVDKNGLGSFLFTKFVAVSSSGINNRIMTSDDGKDWKIIKSPKNKEDDYIDNDWQSVAYGKGLFVAVSSSGGSKGIMTSDNGEEWVIRESPKDNDGNYIDNDWQSVAYGKGLFVAVSNSGEGNRIMTSQNGVNWMIRESPKDKKKNYIDNDWQGVTYGKGMFVVVSNSGEGNRIMTSDDGVNWIIGKSPKDKDGNYIDNDWQSVTYGKGLFVAVASNGDNNRIMKSNDGINWTRVKVSANNNWQSITYGKGVFVMVADNGIIMKSNDGTNWTRINPADNNWQGVTYGKGIFVAVASSGEGDRIITSDDGENWTKRTSPADNNWQSVSYFDSGLYPGNYRIIEKLPEVSLSDNFWVLNKIKCILENGDSTGTSITRGLENVSVYAGKTTKCTFDSVLSNKTESESKSPSGGGGSVTPKKPSI